MTVHCPLFLPTQRARLYLPGKWGQCPAWPSQGVGGIRTLGQLVIHHFYPRKQEVSTRFLQEKCDVQPDSVQVPSRSKILLYLFLVLISLTHTWYTASKTFPLRK